MIRMIMAGMIMIRMIMAGMIMAGIETNEVGNNLADGCAC